MNIPSHHPDYDETTQVLIVGGGLVGLSTCLFLTFHGIRSLLVERHPGTAIHCFPSLPIGLLFRLVRSTSHMPF